MKINDVLEGLIIESLASDPVTGLQAGRIYYNSTTNEVRKYNGSAWDIVVDGLSTQSLSNKTLVAPVVTGGAQIDNVTVTGTASNGFVALRNQSANPIAVTNYTKVFPKTDEKLYSLDQLGVEREIVQSLAGTATVAALSAGKVTVTGTAGAGFQEIAGQSATPTPPAVGYVRLYAKPDNKLYIQDSAGNESAVGTGSGGTVVKVALAAHGFALGEALYLNSGNFTRGIATASNTAEIVGVVSTVVDPNNFELTLSGKVTGLSGLTPGAVYFLSATVAGQLTLTEPTTLGVVSIPIGVADSATTLLVGIKRGVVLGGTNARTSLPLANNATTTIQDVAAYDAGEITGWVYINTTSAKRFYISIPFAKNGAGTDYNVSYETVGDVPPFGFDVTVTSAGLIRITLPLISPFTSALINYALNAPAVGATFPLSVSSTSVNTVYTAITGATTLGSNHHFVSASGASTYAVTLPTAVGFTGKQFAIKSMMNTGVILTVNTTSSQTMDGVTSLVLGRFESLQVISNGSNWEIF